MDETSAAAEIGEERAENVACNVDKDDENNENSSAKDAADGDELFCCRDCGEAFSEEPAYLEHRLQHPPQNTHLDSQSKLLDSEKDNEALYFCSYCTLSFVEMSELHLHMKDHDQISLKGSDVNPRATKQHAYECSDCGKSYTVIGHFLNHQRSHRQPSKSVFHDLEHLKKKSFQCEACGRNYSRVSALDAHRRCHQEKLVKSKNRSSGETVQPAEPPAEVKPCENPTEEDGDRLFKCLCGKAFSSMMRLKTHQRFSRNALCSPEEMKQKPKKGCAEFYCSECNKAFNGHIALFNHQRWHANRSDNAAKRFPCEECGKEFMTLTFYYRHQRTAHSDETPSKSFQHQVCQLQKKAFECKDCGLKFSRASALQSHQLQHTDVFRETEKAPSESTLPSQRGSESEQKVSEHVEASVDGAVKAETIPPTDVGGEQQTSEMDEEMESYEPGDFNVQVISASESEDEGLQETNPDLELLCESDQDIREDGEVYPVSLVSKPHVDLKIVQIDFEQSSQSPSIENEAQLKAGEERFGCPECYWWFNNPSSLHVHRMWHNVRRRRHQTRGQSEEVYNCDTFPHEAQSSGSLIQAETSLEENAFACGDCDQVFTQLPALLTHQLHHPKRKQFQCPHCTSSYLHAASLYNHLKTCTTQKRETISVSKKEYNPKKTLLGPKIYHCEQCGKGFWSLGAYSHHKQNQMECVDLRLRKGVSGSSHSNGRSRSAIKVACPFCGRKFRHKGIMALHMRKHENGDHKCEICGRSFRLFSSLLRHEVVHSDLLLPPPAKSFQHQVEQLKKNTYACPDCGKLFSRAKALQFHMKSHGYETGHSPSSTGTAEALKDLQCETCFAHFTKKSSLRAHQKLCRSRCSEGGGTMEHSEKDAAKPEGVDADMQEMSKQIHEGGSDALKMERHLKGRDSGSNKWKYQCKVCNKSFSAVGAMNIHKRTHIECSKGVAKSNSPISLVLKGTKKDEQSKGLIHCSDCGRRFTTKSALGSHKRWHRNEKGSPSSLKDALSSVCRKTEDEGFKCEKCGKHFFNRHVLQRHWIFNPQCLTGTNPEPNADLERNGSAKQFSCPECDRTFGQVSLLASHYEKEHRKILESGETPGEPFALASEQTDVSHAGSESLSLVLKTKTHQCPLCSMTFEKARGLRAHKWQAHADCKKSKMNLLLRENVEQRSLKDEVEQTEHSVISSKEIKEVHSDPVGPVLCLDSGKKSSSAEAPPFPSNMACLEVKQKTETAEATDEVPPLPSRVSEHTVKYLFKCDKCGKAFQTEEQLESHKMKAKSRPYCCALCCHGFWTESQLQQHLAWHDQVRCRLPSEVRLWLSSAVTSKPFKPNDGKGKLLPPPAASEPTRPRPHQAVDVQAFADGATETQAKENGITCEDCGLTFSVMDAYETHLHQHALDEEEAQLRDNEAPTEQGEENECEDQSFGMDGCDADGSAQTQPPQLTQSSRCPVNPTRYTCAACGKSYTYLVSFQKHQKMHEKPREKEKIQDPVDPNLRLYECPDCGMSFIRRTRLITHLRVHRSKSRGNFPKCDQCNKVFISVKTWTAHLELHKERRFWCLSCAQGFLNEGLLDKHLQNHSRRPQNHKAEDRSIHDAKPPASPPKMQRKQKSHVCLHCGKRFWRSRQLFRHTQKHVRREGRVATKPPGSSAIYRETVDIKTETSISEGEKLELDASMEELQVKEEDMQVEGQSPYAAAEDRDQDDSEDSDCGEPGHHYELSEPRHSDDQPDQPSAEAAQSPTGGETEKSEPKLHREHKYCEWECIECDMGFDEMAKLHSHYVKHATGELPIPKEEIEV